MQMDAKLKHATEVHITEVSNHGSKHLALSLSPGSRLTIFSKHKIGAEDCKHLALSLSPGSRLTIFSKHKIGAEGCKHLAALTGLQTLTIRTYNKIGAEGCKHLASLTWLQTLAIESNEIGAEGRKHLAALTGLQTLTPSKTSTRLATRRSHDHRAPDYSHHRKQQRDWRGGLQVPRRSHLAQTLTIFSENKIGAEGSKHLAALTGLQTLTIESNEIGVEGCKHCAAFTGLQKTLTIARDSCAWHFHS
jgi:hypothetical protein